MKIPVEFIRVKMQDDGVVSLSVVDENGNAKLNLIKRAVRDGTLVFDEQARRLLVAVIEAYQKRVLLKNDIATVPPVVAKTGGRVSPPYSIDFDDLRMEQDERGS